MPKKNPDFFGRMIKNSIFDVPKVRDTSELRRRSFLVL